jgi:hypothetical protein
MRAAAGTRRAGIGADQEFIMVDAPASAPGVSILLPTFNRARFLDAAFEAIAAQTFTNWELIIVDDGSTDDTAAVVDRWRATIVQPIVYVRQPNGGPYAARNTALDHATRDYVAFYDSDDLWLPHHLDDGVRALDGSPDVDWVYGACRVVTLGSGAVTDPDTFRMAGQPRPFMGLGADARGPLRVVTDDAAVELAVTHGLYCGLQNSVLRRSVFDGIRFESQLRNEAEDQLFVIRALKRGHRLGYLDQVHVQYHVHAANSSGSALGQTVDRQIDKVYGPLVRGFEQLRAEFDWTPRERRAIARRLAREHFWHVGYALLWTAGRRDEALAAFRRGLREWPWSLRCWKTYLLARLRSAPAASRAPEAA